jgi:hypothetical protein
MWVGSENALLISIHEERIIEKYLGYRMVVFYLMGWKGFN